MYVRACAHAHTHTQSGVYYVLPISFYVSGISTCSCMCWVSWHFVCYLYCYRLLGVPLALRNLVQYPAMV